MDHSQDSGPSTPGSFAYYDPGSCSWRTSQGSLFAASDESSVTWPLSGTLRSGRVFERAILERHIGGAVYSSSPNETWATPKAADASGIKRGPKAIALYSSKPTLTEQMEEWIGRHLPAGTGLDTMALNPLFVEALMGLPLNWTASAESDLLAGR